MGGEVQYEYRRTVGGGGVELCVWAPCMADAKAKLQLHAYGTAGLVATGRRRYQQGNGGVVVVEPKAAQVDLAARADRQTACEMKAVIDALVAGRRVHVRPAGKPVPWGRAQQLPLHRLNWQAYEYMPEAGPVEFAYHNDGDWDYWVFSQDGRDVARYKDAGEMAQQHAQALTRLHCLQLEAAVLRAELADAEATLKTYRDDE